jgi:hypothetical protein
MFVDLGEHSVNPQNVAYVEDTEIEITVDDKQETEKAVQIVFIGDTPSIMIRGVDRNVIVNYFNSLD